MKKPRSILVLLLTAAIWILPLAAACDSNTPRADAFDPKDFVPTPSPTDWISPAGSSVHHVEVESFDMEKVPAVKIELPAEQVSELLSPLSDGGCLAVSVKTAAGENSKVAIRLDLRAIRFNPDGSVLWDRVLDTIDHSGYVTALSVFPDGAFVIGVRPAGSISPNRDPVDLLYRFSPEGNLQWKTDAPLFATGAIEHLFSLPDGAVLAVGTVSSKESNDISLIRMEQDGTLTRQLILVTPQYDTLMDADYAPGIGLVILYRNEDFGTAGVSPRQRSSLGCFNEQVQKIWTVETAVGEPLYQVDAVDGKGILAQGYVQDASTSHSTLFYFSPLGAKTWSCTPADQPSWLTGAAVLKNGQLVVSSFHQTEEGGQATLLTIHADNGTILTEMEQMPGMATQLIPTADGGFTLVLRQGVRSLPQPPHISSLWTDTEAIVAHYDKDLRLKWRRTIDQYKHSLRTDNIIATVDDRLFVG